MWALWRQDIQECAGTWISNEHNWSPQSPTNAARPEHSTTCAELFWTCSKQTDPWDSSKNVLWIHSWVTSCCFSLQKRKAKKHTKLRGASGWWWDCCPAWCDWGWAQGNNCHRHRWCSTRPRWSEQRYSGTRLSITEIDYCSLRSARIAVQTRKIILSLDFSPVVSTQCAEAYCTDWLF